MIAIIAGIAGLLVGAVIGYFLFTNALTKKKEALIAEAEAKAETIRKEKERRIAWLHGSWDERND